MRSRMIRSERSVRTLVVTAALVCACATVIIVLSQNGRGHEASANSPISPAETVEADATVSGVLPGAQANLDISAGPQSVNPPGTSNGAPHDFGAEQLTITESASNFAPPGDGGLTPTAPGEEQNDSAAGELGWRAALAAGQVGEQNPNVMNYAATVQGVTFTPWEREILQGQIRSGVGAAENSAGADIGSVALTTLKAQAAANLKTLEGALPPGELVGARIVTVPVDAPSGAYAFEFDLTVNSLADLKPYVGDIVQGLRTGLVGGPAAPSDGVAINIVDSSGRRAGWWASTRASTGGATADPSLSVAGSFAETTAFANLTGGPAPTSFAVGGSPIK